MIDYRKRLNQYRADEAKKVQVQVVEQRKPRKGYSLFVVSAEKAFIAPVAMRLIGLQYTEEELVVLVSRIDGVEDQLVNPKELDCVAGDLVTVKGAGTLTGVAEIWQ